MSSENQRRLPITILPPKVATEPAQPATFIFLHGYGWSADQFNQHPPNRLSVAHHVHKSPILQNVKVVIPEGLANIWPSPGKHTWYNIDQPVPSAGDPLKTDEFGQHQSNVRDIEVSLDYFEHLIDIEVATGTPANRIVFMGDSQGASILYLFLLTRKKAADVAAIITWAGFSATPLETIAQMREKNGLSESWAKKTRLYMLHGREDVFVPLSRSKALATVLDQYRARGQGFATLEWVVLDGLRHSLVEPVWPNVRQILEHLLTEKESASKL
ncbi:hypothetical protein BCIN_06g00870 [Botrytis cinerea B05.10]|uniref:Acyl-protein thioesterase 1 n=3 Tax=Botryotinia fuckeliana TaxID=40559 RepID=A0A384JJ69_BOTFB|nr:hypothetical protein BCIN_06g00870 [Botrytis cinerea B05.10]ATZ50590.1 hypothetical protein BCIN_06g00870 [Botrytis cinerea B05.10]EMR84177.1 putative acyl-protein thioesterase 1 protein [Botrytis cinerea BcDW1]CCD49237.1 hypothetical protein BofuT4_P031130.1 [Botrytis cinerea T4]